jgi:hypothetical protein
VLDADAEAEPAHRLEVIDVVSELLENEARPNVVRRVDVGERRGVIAVTASPGHAAQILAVVDAVVEERSQAVLFDRIPEPQLGGDAVIEPVQDR